MKALADIVIRAEFSISGAIKSGGTEISLNDEYLYGLPVGYFDATVAIMAAVADAK